MPRAAKWLGILLGGVLGIAVLAVAVVYGLSSYRMSRIYDIQPAALTIPTDQTAMRRGEHLVKNVSGCTDCHGPDLAGTAFIEDAALGNLYAKNLTKGRGGVGATYSDADFVRAIRHGVKKDGQPVLFMPANEFANYSDADLGAIIAYVKSVAAVDKELPASSVGPLGRALYVTGQLPQLVPVELIDHAASRSASVQPGPTVAYGKYLASASCVGCHGAGLSGGPIPGAPPEFPAAANLTKGGDLGAWSDADFIKTIRTGVNPKGKTLDEFMPWKNLKNLTDDELKAL